MTVTSIAPMSAAPGGAELALVCIKRPVPPTIRAARPTDADVLSRLAQSSKAHWGYDAAFLESAAADLTVAPAFIAAQHVYLLEDEGVAIAFYSLMPTTDATSVEHFFVAPHAIGTGVGARLFRHLVETATALGVKRLHIGSDPNAEGFYLRQGARRIGTVASIVPGRVLPLLEFEL
jgi:GNAT superfamily N-acetyltransferase